MVRGAWCVVLCCAKEGGSVVDGYAEKKSRRGVRVFGLRLIGEGGRVLIVQTR